MLKFEQKIHNKVIVNVSREEHPLYLGYSPLFRFHQIGRFQLSFTLMFQLWYYKIMQNIYQKLTPGFKNHTRNLDNFRKALESPKRSKSMGYFCPKITFLQLNIIYRKLIYLTFNYLFTNFHLSFKKPQAIFHGTTPLYFFSSNIT